MVLTHYIRTSEFDKHLYNLLELGKKQGGYVTIEQLHQELSAGVIVDNQRAQLIDLLSRQNVIIRKQHVAPKKSQEELDRRMYFIDDDKINLKPVKQVDKCLTYEDYYALFLAKYDEKLKNGEKKRIFQRLSSRITHVEKCVECISWCKCGHHYYVETCNGTISFPNDLFFKFFDKEYERFGKQPGEKRLIKSQQIKNKKADE